MLASHHDSDILPLSVPGGQGGVFRRKNFLETPGGSVFQAVSGTLQLCCLYSCLPSANGGACGSPKVWVQP